MIRRVHWLGCFGWLLAACGGGAAVGSAPKDPEATDEPVETEAAPEEVELASAPVDPCASGTCFTCGEAICLAGFYCEPAHSSCGWLPECAKTPTCACIREVLGDCRCEENGAAVIVECE